MKLLTPYFEGILKMFTFRSTN